MPKAAALGFRMHSGWGVLVAVSGTSDDLLVVDRSRFVVMDSDRHGGNQPYHYAAGLRSQPDGAKKSAEHIDRCGALSESLAIAALTDVSQKLQLGQYQITGAAILTAAGRTLPSLPEILASHPLIHTAEGEFFCDAVIRACEKLNIPTEKIRERDIEGRARLVYGSGSSRVRNKIASLGKSIGPPWTSDHKNAALAALLMLKEK